MILFVGVATTANSLAEHSDIIVPLFVGLLSCIGVLIIAVATILWNHIVDNKRAVDGLREKIMNLPEFYIDKSFCISCQKGQDNEASGIARMLKSMEERQLRMEDSINDLRALIMKMHSE